MIIDSTEYRASEVIKSIVNINILLYQDFTFCYTAPIEETIQQKLLFRLRSVKYLDDLLAHKWNIAGVICSFDIADIVSKHFPVIASDEPERLFWIIHNNLYRRNTIPSNFGEGCEISERASISPFGISIGDHVVIEEFAVIREGVTIGNNTVIRAGCVIGGEGFQHYKDSQGVISIRHIGTVEIGDNVEIQYNSCVDKALYKYMSTIIADGVRIDNLVQIGHAAHLYKDVFAASGSVLGGYVEIKDGCFIGMNSSIRQHVIIGSDCLIGMNSAVIKNAGGGETISGFPARTIEKK